MSDGAQNLLGHWNPSWLTAQPPDTHSKFWGWTVIYKRCVGLRRPTWLQAALDVYMLFNFLNVIPCIFYLWVIVLFLMDYLGVRVDV